MAFGNKETALLFKIKGDSSDAERSIKSVDGQVKSLTGQMGTASAGVASFGASFAAIAGPATVALAGIAAGFTAAAAAGAVLFRLAKEASDFGSAIFDASTKTGLAAETMSALAYAANQSGSSLEQVSGAVSKFSKLVGDAATGSKEAAEKLKRLGIEPQEAIADLDGALEKIFKRIADAPPGVLQTKAAVDAFGKSGADIIPVIQSFDGDLGKLIDTAKSLGVTLDDDAAKAADEFGDALDDVSAATKGLTYTFAREFLPTITSVMRDITNLITQNKAAFQTWGVVIRNVLEGLRAVYTWFTSGAGQYVLQAIGAVMRYVTPESIRIAAGQVVQVATTDASGNGTFIPGGDTDADGKTPRQPVGGGFGGGGGGGAARKSEADAIAKRNISAGIQYWTNYVADLKEKFKTAVDAFKKDFEATGDSDVFTQRLANAAAKWQELINEAQDNIVALEEKQVAAEKKTSAEIAVILQERGQRYQDWVEIAQKAVADGEKLKSDAIEKESKKRIAIDEKEFQREQSVLKSRSTLRIAELERDRQNQIINEVDFQKALARERLGAIEDELEGLRSLQENRELDAEKRAEIANRITVLENELAAKTIENLSAVQKAIEDTTFAMDRLSASVQGATGEAPEVSQTGTDGPFDGWTESWNGFKDALVGSAPTIGSVMADIGKMLRETLWDIAQGVGQMVQNWVLLGETGPAAMKKILAAALASLAAEAATRAIFELAMGFASLFFNPAEAAAHFTAAAIFGTIAVGAGLAGRAIAGDSFKQKSAATAATGSNTQTSRSGSGGAYSGQETMTVNGGRNASAGNGGVMVIKDKSGMFDRLFEWAWDSNGPMRQRLIQEFGK